MLLPQCAIFDKKTGLYDQPFTVRHINEAIRQWDIVKKDTKTKFGTHPEDYDMYQLATFDDETGEFQSIKPLHLASGLS